MKKKLTRRRFLVQAGLSSAGLLILRDNRSLRGAPANEKINVALIGVGGRGTWFVNTIPRMENIVAMGSTGGSLQNLTPAMGTFCCPDL